MAVSQNLRRIEMCSRRTYTPCLASSRPTSPISGARGGLKTSYLRPLCPKASTVQHYNHQYTATSIQFYNHQDISTTKSPLTNSQTTQDAHVQRTSSPSSHYAGLPLTNIADHPQGRRLAGHSFKVRNPLAFIPNAIMLIRKAGQRMMPKPKAEKSSMSSH